VAEATGSGLPNVVLRGLFEGITIERIIRQFVVGWSEVGLAPSLGSALEPRNGISYLLVVCES
jgi:hypothetical protein